jgi:hypothetical protein
MAACLLSGFILTTGRAAVRAPKGPPRSVATTASSADLSSRSAVLLDDSATSRTPQTTQPQLARAYGKVPLRFEINRGQTDSCVKFLSPGSGYSLLLTGNEALLALGKGSRQSNKCSAALQGGTSG